MSSVDNKITATTATPLTVVDRCQHIVNQMTIPGYTMESEHFTLSLITVCQEERPVLYLEYRTDWTEVMQLLLMVLETFPESVKRFQTFAAVQLEAWSAARCRLICTKATDSDSSSCQHPVAAEVHLTERDFYPEPRGTTKHLTLRLTHRHVETEIVLDVRRKVRMRSLRELAAARFGASVRYIDDMEQLAEPMSWQVRRELMDDWTPAYFDRNCASRILRQAAAMVAPPAKQRRNLTTLSACPYCQRTGFRSVRLHVAKNRRCGELWEMDKVEQ